MNDTLVTLQGWLGSDVTVRRAGDSVVASFRLASTPRRYQKRNESWVDGETQWYTVSVWRALAENCSRSLRRGDPVVVMGRLHARTWTNQSGVDVTTLEIEATSLGHDLARGVSTFARTPRATVEDPAPAPVPPEAPEAPGEQSVPAA